MKVVLYTQLDGVALKRLLSKLNDDCEALPISTLGRTIRNVSANASVYVDISGMSESEVQKKARDLAAKGVKAGCLDRDGTVSDPAAVIRAGATDYVGPAMLKLGVDARRLQYAAGSDAAEALTRQEISFPGWRALRVGDEYRFLFCFAAIADQAGLRSKIGDKRIAALKESFASLFSTTIVDADGLVWMRDQVGVLVLFPVEGSGKAPVRIAFEMLLNRALIGYETFGLEVPVSFRFAFHVGTTVWRRPGDTGEIVSEDVNYIYHLALKNAEEGRITLSSTCDRMIPEQLCDLFEPGRRFEGRDTTVSHVFR